MDISIPIAQLNEALQTLADCDFTDAELLSECETAIDNVELRCDGCLRPELTCSQDPCGDVVADRETMDDERNDDSVKPHSARARPNDYR